MNKKEIRNKINEKLSFLEKEYIDIKSESIYFNLIKSKLLEDKKDILFYLNIKNEVKTDFMIKNLKDKNIFLPKVIGEDMLALRFYDFKSLEIGKYSIMEPKKESQKAKKLDAVIVPLVAVDRSGARIGKGKGYYDRFLKKYNTLKIGICYNFQVVEKIEKEEFDVNLDYIITETEIIKVENN